MKRAGTRNIFFFYLALLAGENIILIDSIIRYAAEQHIPGLLLFIDFEKAFDSLEWSFVNRTLQSYRV